MSTTAPLQGRSLRRSFVKVHRWLGIAAAAFWIVQALTGLILSFHFELEDASLSTARVPTDLAAIERRIDAFADSGPDAAVNFIWTTAGLPDRYVISYVDTSGETRLARIDGAGEILRDRHADDHSFLTMMRAIHLDLMAGKVGHWISAITGGLLATNLLFGLWMAWPARGQWRRALVPIRKGGPQAKAYSWHRALGLWAVAPAFIIAMTGTLMLFEHEVGHVLGVEEIALPANPPAARQASFAQVHDAAVAAIPGSRFVGTTMPSREDASYYAWVHAPGELYRGGYAGSLVIVDANDASVRGAWPATEHGWARYLMYSLYPMHTGEAGGLPGRILATLIGVWLLVLMFLGLQLWWRRRRRSASAAARTPDVRPSRVAGL